MKNRNKPIHNSALIVTGINREGNSPVKELKAKMKFELTAMFLCIWVDIEQDFFLC